MVELADALDSKSSGSDTIPVRPRSAAPSECGKNEPKTQFLLHFLFENYPAAHYDIDILKQIFNSDKLLI